MQDFLFNFSIPTKKNSCYEYSKHLNPKGRRKNDSNFLNPPPPPPVQHYLINYNKENKVM